MAFTKVILLAFMALVAASPIIDTAGDLQKRTAQTVTATFDELKPRLIVVLNTIPVPYKGLNYSSFIYQNPGTLGLAQGVIPNTQPIYIASNGPLSPYRTPALSTKGTSTKSFDLISFYYGCLTTTETSQGQVATSCTFSISGVKASTGAAVAPVAFRFTPTLGVLLGSPMQKATLPSTFTGLRSATIQLLSSGILVATPVFVGDTFKYTIYT